MRLNSKQILQYTGGTYLIEPIDPSKILTSFTWDSRDVVPDCLFVALEGEHVNGIEYVKSALNAGAGCVLVNETPDAKACLLAQELGAGIIEVSNTYHAIEDLASHWRGFLKAKVVAITGSVGKTTTKNLVRDVCAYRFKTTATIANQNNELGVPNTILSADPDTQVVVVEMGMRGSGQIAHLCKIARPDWGIITNIGECHMELLGSQEAIARAKGELLCAVPDGSGCVFVNASIPMADTMLEEENVAQRRVVLEWFGACDAVASRLSETEHSHDGSVDIAHSVNLPQTNSQCWYEDLALDGEGRPTFTLCARGYVPESESVEPTLFDMEPDIQRRDCHLSIGGAHNAANATAAAAVGLTLGMTIDDVVAALDASVPEAGRLETIVAREGFTVINDAYNANPDSMRAALSMISSFSAKGKKVAVLGDMGELGDIEIECHKGVGRVAGVSEIDRLICVGELSREIALGAKEAGMDAGKIDHVSNVAGALELLEGNLDSQDVVLVKASHFMHLDRLVEGLVS